MRQILVTFSEYMNFHLFTNLLKVLYCTVWKAGKMKKTNTSFYSGMLQGQCRQKFCCARLFEITDSAELWFHKQREDKVVSCFWKKIVTCDFSLARIVTICPEPIWIEVKISWNILHKASKYIPKTPESASIKIPRFRLKFNL